ncbi:MAG: stage II sporulation protein P [Lachnospiraceae bacterium]|nr:stage II sporulation protein P [Lachnospiraceae bacterium]
MYIFILILVAVVLMGNGNYISKSVIINLREEVIPLSEVCDNNKSDIYDEVFPAYSVRDNIIIDNENSYDVSYQETLESEVKMATSDDAYEIAVEGNTQQGTESTNDEHIETVEAVAVNSDIELNDIGINYSMEQLSDFEFLIGNCYTIDGSTSVTSEDINIETLLSEDLSLDISDDEYKVLIYHTHASETFIDSRPGVEEDTIIGVGSELARILEEDYGIKAYHDKTIYDMVDGKLDRNYAYTQSGNGIDKILEQYPSIEVILDIHRDGVRDEVHLMKVIDGKPTAQIMFFNGISRLNDEGDLGYLHNPNLASNLSFSLQMHLKGKALYGDLMRNIYIGGYCYNLDRKPRASLVEVGAQTNTVEEAKNAMIPLAALLYSVLSGN